MAHELAIETVYQDKSLGEQQPLWRNFFVGRQITNRFGFIDIKREKAIANDILMRAIGFRGVGIGADSTVKELSGGERQGIAIGRAMHFDADLIVLDEPTAALAVKEVRKVLDFVGQIKASGRACVYIEHNLAHVHAVADRLVIVDRGRIVAQLEPKEMTVAELTEYPDRPAAPAMSASRPAPSPLRRLARLEGLPIIIVFGLLLGLFMTTAPHRVPGAQHLHHVPLDPAAAGAAGGGLTFVIGAGEIDLSFPSVIAFSGFVFALLFKEYDLGWLAVVVAAGQRPAGRLGQRRAGGGDRHPVVHRDAGDAVLLVGHGHGALRRQVLCPARCRRNLRLAAHGRPADLQRRSVLVAEPALGAGAVDGRDRGLPVVRPQPAPVRRAHAVHRRQQPGGPRRRHRRRCARRSSCSC